MNYPLRPVEFVFSRTEYEHLKCEEKEIISGLKILIFNTSELQIRKDERRRKTEN